jgi:HD-like signal output (HDOD) protein
MRHVARVVERDAGITGRLLRSVNNAFFAPAQRITSVEQAVTHLGTEMLTGLVLSLECFGNFEDTLAECSLVPSSLERKAFLAATIASGLLTDRTQQQDAFLSALLHDSGLLLAAARQPSLVAKAVQASTADNSSLPAAERKLWGTSHAEIGAYLLGLWGLPYPVVEGVARVHSPEQLSGPEVDVATAVYIAAALAEAAMHGDLSAVELDADLLARKNLQGRLPELIERVERVIGAEVPVTNEPKTTAPVH